MAILPVDSVIARSSDSNNVTTGAIDTTGATLLVLVSSTFGGSATISDSKGNTWTPRTQYGAADATVRIYYAENATGGTGHTFTASSTGLSPTISVIALAGTLTASVFDQENGSTLYTGVATMASGSVTPSEDNEILITGISEYSQDIVSIDGGFTIAESHGGSNMRGGLAYLIQGTAAAANPTWTIAATGVGIVAIATFKAAAVGGSILPLVACDMANIADMVGMRG